MSLEKLLRDLLADVQKYAVAHDLRHLAPRIEAARLSVQEDLGITVPGALQFPAPASTTSLAQSVERDCSARILQFPEK